MIATTKHEKETLKAAGQILRDALSIAEGLAVVGSTTAQLDLAAEEYIRSHGAKPAFFGYQPEGARTPYPAVLCVSINDEVVHGIPSEARILQEGDVVSIDLGLSLHGLFVDSARTFCVGKCDADAARLIQATKEAIDAGIQAAQAEGHIGDIGAAVEKVAKKYNYAIIEGLGGHAVGKAVHEQPYIPNEGKKGEGEEILEGMVLAIEPMLSEGKGEITLKKDGWTYAMWDGSRAAHFEHTVLVTKDEPIILTA